MNKRASLFPSFSRHLSILGLISSKHQTRVSQVQGSSFSLNSSSLLVYGARVGQISYFGLFYMLAFARTSRLHCQNYGTVGIGEPTGFRVLSGRSLFRSLSLFSSAVQ
ncbi:hypothetical protein HanOQP8_Chr02g0051711 [Helianthus annuus]|nr:hypothetical protein HanOQP8_Chr02g0051711 [Helianthus annuus]